VEEEKKSEEEVVEIQAPRKGKWFRVIDE